MNKTKNLITIPLINIWYVVVTLIFILMRLTNIIDWSPLWLLSPLWIPWVLSLCLLVLPYLLMAIGWCIFKTYDLVTMLYNKTCNLVTMLYNKYVHKFVIKCYSKIKLFVIKYYNKIKLFIGKIKK